MPRQITWIAVETIKDSTERGKNLGLIHEVLEEEVEQIVLDVDGVPYEVKVLGIGATRATATNNMDMRMNNERHIHPRQGSSK